ncbi:GTP cyclohydrolase I [Microbacteriaceae bacterium MWH-Ta3]|nr:GTP cyclohydrolase I [Microbacteriaceae bacterium MWH-Ta3]
MTVQHERIAAAVRDILDAIGEDVSRPGLADTPARVADAFAELYSGVGIDPVAMLIEPGSCADVDSHDTVIVRGIRFRSMCEHHLLPFHGIAHVAYVPESTVVGLGRIARLVDIVSSRPQVQERLGQEIAEALIRGVHARGTLVVLEATHECVAARGSRQESARAVTVSSSGELAIPAARDATLVLMGAPGGD